MVKVGGERCRYDVWVGTDIENEVEGDNRNH